MSVTERKGSVDGKWTEVLSRGSKRKNSLSSEQSKGESSPKRKTVSFNDPLMSSTPRKNLSEISEDDNSFENSENNHDNTIKVANGTGNIIEDQNMETPDDENKVVDFLRKLMVSKEEVINHKEMEKDYLRSRIKNLETLLNEKEEYIRMLEGNLNELYIKANSELGKTGLPSLNDSKTNRG